MRINHEIVTFLKRTIGEKIPGSSVYLFGSRAQDDAVGGDIDVMIITPKPIDKKIVRSIRIEFYKKFGWQKIDLVHFTDSDQSVFKRLIQTNCIAL